MHLEKLEIQGFKSFALKSTLGFPGMLTKTMRGITAIVGPNGSGKSNIADAVRWALGEQSVKLLRGKKGEDVIFSGTRQKGRLGMAQVSLFLNNEAKKAPIDYSQIVVTRRIFRDGASEYLINNAKARLIDIQLLLARARFGQRSYSVIGQGIVEGFLNITASERKEFFDEATGVKQFQIKRGNALVKLKTSYENMNQAQMILAELEPRYKNLDKQVEKMRQKKELEANLEKLQIKYYSRIWHEINDKFNEFNNKFNILNKEKLIESDKLEQINQELLVIEKKYEENKESDIAQNELAALQNKKNELIRQIAKLDARLETSLESKGKFDLSWLYNKKEELKKEQVKILNDINALGILVKDEEKKLINIKEEEKKITQEIIQINNQLQELNFGKKKSKQQIVNNKLSNLLLKIIKIEAISSIEEIKNNLCQFRKEIKEIIESSEGRQEEEQIIQLQKNVKELVSNKEQVLHKINNINIKIISSQERIKLTREKNVQIKNELISIEEKIKNSEKKPDNSNNDLKIKLKQLNIELEKIEIEIKIKKEKINKNALAEQEKRKFIFDKQKQAQVIQININQIQNQINTVKINSTRYETRLEDLEAEIRTAFNEVNQQFSELEVEVSKNKASLKLVKKNRYNEYIDTDKAINSIGKIKRQLEFIGNIEPEVEKEYLEIKSRYNFLKSQIADLSETIKSLEKIIQNLDKTIKEKFDKGFNIIKEKFLHYFKILFDGGEAEIVKLTDKNKEEQNGLFEKYNGGIAGIDIYATPPGKKIQSVSMLSGGERALTAIALICACLSSNPSPFVVLDEVDAALDESNSERLAKILDDLSHKTQFIAITHNRAIMRRANALYGVTMEDNGVSKLLSIKLGDIK